MPSIGCKHDVLEVRVRGAQQRLPQVVEAVFYMCEVEGAVGEEEVVEVGVWGVRGGGEEVGGVGVRGVRGAL